MSKQDKDRLRNTFAAAALQGLLANTCVTLQAHVISDAPKYVAQSMEARVKAAWQIADAMLEGMEPKDCES